MNISSYCLRAQYSDATSTAMAKKIGLGLLVLLVIMSTSGCIVKKIERKFFTDSPNYLTHNCEEEAIRFVWNKGKYGEFTEPHDAILIPVSIDGWPHRFYFQFDTGSPTSYIYQNALLAFEAVQGKVDRIEKEDARFLPEFEFSQDGQGFKLSMLEVLNGYGRPFIQQDTSVADIKIGTIGTDFIDQKIAIIDFKNQVLQLYTERPSWVDTLTGFTDFEFIGRRLLLPAQIDEQTLKLVYDTGSSAFGLITSKNRYKRYSDRSAPEITYATNSWGKSVNVYHKASNQKISIGNSLLDLERLSYVGMYGFLQQFATPFTQIGGWLGNKPFINSMLILDTQREEFLILEL